MEAIDPSLVRVRMERFNISLPGSAHLSLEHAISFTSRRRPLRPGKAGGALGCQAFGGVPRPCKDAPCCPGKDVMRPWAPCRPFAIR